MASAVTLIGLDEAVRAVVRQELDRLVEHEAQGPVGFLNIKSAAQFLDVSVGSLRARVKRNEVPVHRQGGRLFFDRLELLAWVRGEAA